MLARSNLIKHPSGIEIETPLLVSSFSTKGFRFVKSKGEYKSETFELIKQMAEYLSETVLLSAYDLNYYFPKFSQFRTARFFPKLIFIDSGGYETLNGYDFSENYKHPVIERPWTVELYNGVLNSWPGYYPSVIVSYDNGNDRKKSITKQIEMANKLFDNHPNQLNDFLIKPQNKDDFLNVKVVVDNISLLKRFNIIGLTEKELGESIIQRMHNIRYIREALDKIDCQSPIHIFGNLDPLTSILYFLAGAEIFDGLTWLRFSFYEGKSVYFQNSDAIKNKIHEKDYLNYRTSLVENQIYMRSLQSEMRSFIKAVKSGASIENAVKTFSFCQNEILHAYSALYSK